MLIHLVPKLLTPVGQNPSVRLVDLSIEELGLVLKGDQDLTIRQPYPNKRYWVACRKVGRKAISGLFVQTDKHLPSYTVVTRWAINADAVLTHRVSHVVLDDSFDSVTDDMLYWCRISNPLGGWSARWPACYADMVPVHVMPRLDVTPPRDQKRVPIRREEVSPEGLVVFREELYMVHTVEQGRFFGPLSRDERMPALEDAFHARVP